MDENKSQNPEEKQQITESKMMVMPDEFHQAPADSSSGNRKMIIIFSAIIIVAIGGGLSVFFLLRNPSTPSAEIALNDNSNQATEPAEEEPKQEEDVVTEPETSVNENINVPTIPQIFADIPGTSRDTDLDGLTDTEEAMYGTNLNLKDSDGDGHQDQLELINLYNPAAGAPADLINSGLVKLFTNDSFSYSIYYPTKFIARALDTKDTQVMFTAATSEFIEVIVYENSDNMSVINWYLENTQGVSRSDLQTISTKNGYRGIKTRDGLTVYLVKPVTDAITPGEEMNYIYSITYNPGTRNELSFKSTFDMMIASFDLIESGVADVNAPATETE